MEIGTSWASLLCAFRGATAAAAAAKSLQSCPNLCDPIDGSSPDSAVPGILQARTLEWVAIAFSTVCLKFFFMIVLAIQGPLRFHMILEFSVLGILIGITLNL